MRILLLPPDIQLERGVDMSRITNSYTDDDLLKRYIQVVSTQTEFNKDKDKSNTHSNLP